MASPRSRTAPERDGPAPARGVARPLLATVVEAAPWLAAGVPGLAFAVSATRGAIASGLGRDQGIFQYVAWAWARGDVGYRDVRDVNGPLTPLVHLALLALGGADEGRFRLLDAIVTSAVFAATGAILGAASCPRPTRARVAVFAAFGALAGWVVLSAQYLGFIFWDLAQRETFMDWFLLPSLALSFAAARAGRSRLTSGALVAAGALSAATWLGKPTYVLFFALQAAALAIGEGTLRDRGRDVGRLVLGAALGLGLGCALASRWADLGAYARIASTDVPAMYRFIWPRTTSDIVGLRPVTLGLAAATALACAAAAARGYAPRALAALGLAPLAAFASVVLQRKGFPYHFHPMTATLALAWLALLATAVGRLTDRAGAARLVPTALAGALGLWAAIALRDSPHAGLGDLARGTPAHTARFSTFDYFPDELRAAAAHLRATTKPGDRVFHYGMDPYVLFLAERRSATPYVYAYDLDCDAALAGSADPAGMHPTAVEAERIREMCNMHANDALARLAREPPAALVLVDDSPLMSHADAAADLAAHAPELRRWIAERYRMERRFGHVSVWLPANVTERPPEIR